MHEFPPCIGDEPGLKKTPMRFGIFDHLQKNDHLWHPVRMAEKFAYWLKREPA